MIMSKLTGGTRAGPLVASAVLALGAGLAPVAHAQTNITVAVPNPSAITWGPMWAAIGEGYFEQEGLSLSVEAVDGSSQVLQAMSRGRRRSERRDQVRC